MKTTPLIFTADSIRAMLDGRKSQTRRVCTQDFRMQHAARVTRGSDYQFDFIFTDDTGMLRHSPYGQPGDLIWCKEAHYVWSAGYKDESGRVTDTRINYRATEPDAPCTWTSPLFMPRWASRLTLRLTDVRVERVQDISNRDAEAEGIPHSPDVDLSGEYAELWDAINADKPGCDWSANPWVWCISFSVIKANVDEVINGQV